MTDPQIIRNLIPVAKAYVAAELSKSILKRFYGVHDDCQCCDNYDLISDILEKLIYQVDLNLYNGTTENLYNALNDLLGNVSSVPMPPDEGILIEWGYTDTDRTADVDTIDLQFSTNVPSNTGYVCNYTLAANQKYLHLKFPATENDKTSWFNTVLNNGTIPDSVFYAIKTIGDSKYISSRIPVVIDSTNSNITFN